MRTLAVMGKHGLAFMGLFGAMGCETMVTDESGAEGASSRVAAERWAEARSELPRFGDAPHQILLFEEDFDKTRLGPTEIGFVDTEFWEVRGGTLVSSIPLGDSGPARFTTRAFAATRHAGDVMMDWAVRFSGAQGTEGVVSMVVAKEDRTPEYELVFNPNFDRSAKRTDRNGQFLLKMWDGRATTIGRGASSRPTPHGPKAPFVRFRMVFETGGQIQVSSDNGTGSFGLVMKVNSKLHSDFGRLAFTYTADRTANDPVEVDNLRVTSSRGRFLIIVAKAIAEEPSIKPALDTYRQDLSIAGWDTELMTVAPPSDPKAAALALKQDIIQRFKHGLAGFVIIGSDPAIPTVYWRHYVNGGGRDPADLFYADVDTWVDIDGDGIYENFDGKLDGSGQWVADESKPGNPANPKFYPELFFGRIAAGPVAISAADEADKVAAYLARVHRVRTRGTLLTPEQDSRALVFGEGEFQGKDQVVRVSPGAPNLVGLFNRIVTSSDRYADELHAGYRFVTLMSHSTSDSHSLSIVENDLETDAPFTLKWLEDIDAKVSYANLFACGAMNFTVPNFGATFLFKTRFTLNTTGSVGGWGILPDAVYYEDLSAGIPIGVALRDYALRTKDEGEVGWPKGALHGDPLVQYMKRVPNKASIVSSDTKTFRVAVGESLVRTFWTEDLEDDAASISMTGLPAGAVFDGRTLTMTPTAEQEGQTFVAQTTVRESDQSGRYTEPFAIEVAARPLPGVVRNPGFEEGAALPSFWNRNAWDYHHAHYSWADGMGRDGSKGVSISSSLPNDASWVQRVQGLQPGRAYRFVGWLKADAASAESGFGESANLCLFGTWDHVGQSGSFDWTEFSLPFVAPESGEVVVGCRLGYWSNTATGQIWCDEMRIEDSP